MPDLDSLLRVAPKSTGISCSKGRVRALASAPGRSSTVRLKKQGQTERALEAYTNLVAATESLMGTLQGQLESFGLTMSRFRALVAVSRNGPMVQGALVGKALRGDFSNGALVLKNLERDGLIRRVAHERDRRKIVIHLTPDGKALVAKVFPKHAKVVRAQMSALLSREQELLSRLCAKLRIGDFLRFVQVLTAAYGDEEIDT